MCEEPTSESSSSGTPLEQARAAAAAAAGKPPSCSAQFKGALDGGGYVAYALVRDDMIAAFNAADTDQDTFITREELDNVLATLGEEFPADDVEAIWKSANGASSGKIFYEAFCAAFCDYCRKGPPKAGGEKKFFGLF